MTGVEDCSGRKPKESEMPEYVILPGAMPTILEARINKLDALYKNGWCKNIIISGGNIWKDRIPDKPGDTSQQRLLKTKHRLVLQRIFKNLFEYTRSDESTKIRDLISMRKVLVKNSDKYIGESEGNLGYILFKNKNDSNKPTAFIDTKATNTKENSLRSHDIVEDNESEKGRTADDVKKIMIVTSTFHCRRTMLTFKKDFPNAEIIACPTMSKIDKKEFINTPNIINQLRNECKKCIDYIKKGDLADIEIEEIVGKKRATEIEAKMKRTLPDGNDGSREL
jgi:hypothetical protein